MDIVFIYSIASLQNAICEQNCSLTQETIQPHEAVYGNQQKWDFKNFKPQKKRQKKKASMSTSSCQPSADVFNLLHILSITFHFNVS